MTYYVKTEKIATNKKDLWIRENVIEIQELKQFQIKK